MTLAKPEALAPFPSVTVNNSGKEPFIGSVRLMIPVPVYGVVPPLALTVQVKALPAVTPLVGQFTVTVRGWAAIITLADPLAVARLASVTVKDSVKVPLAG